MREPPPAPQPGGPFVPVLHHRLAAPASAVVVAVLAVLGYFVSASPSSRVAGDLAQVVAALAAAGACLVAARRGGEERRCWALFGLSALLWAGGAAVWAYYGYSQHSHMPCPFPSLADLGFLGSAVPAAAGLLSFRRHAPRPVSWVRTTLDTVVIATSVLFVSWFSVLGPTYHQLGEGFWLRTTALAYPLVGVSIASLVLVLGMRRPPGARLVWLLLGGGLVLLAATESVYASHALLRPATTSAAVVVLAPVVAFVLIALSTVGTLLPAPAVPDPRSRYAQELLPYLPVLGAVVVTATTALSTSEPFLFWTGVAVVVAVALRQVMMVVENVTEAEIQELNSALTGRLGELGQAREDLRTMLAKLTQAQEAERKAVSLALHDDAVQSLTAANWAVAELRTADEPERPAVMDRLEFYVNHALTSARGLMSELRSYVLVELGLGAAAAQQLRSLGSSGAVQVNVSDRLAGRRFSDHTETLAYRSVQETLRNIRKHAEASTVELVLELCPAAPGPGEGELVVSIYDDGVGIDAAVAARRREQGHVGLASMEETMRAAGGSFSISRRPSPPGGTVVTLRLPADHPVAEPTPEASEPDPEPEADD